MDRAFSHHPDLPSFKADTYRVLGVRLCIGCFTTFPAFLVVAALLLSNAPGLWWMWLAGGTCLALTQAISAAGRANMRWVKVSVKACLGIGLAAAVHGTLSAPWHQAWKVVALGGFLILALASAIPRSRRMRDAGRTAP